MDMNLVSTANETKAFEEIDVMFSQPPAATASRLNHTKIDFKYVA